MSDTESIQVQCPHCKKRLRVRATAAGKLVRCPQCSKPVDARVASEVGEESGQDRCPRPFWPWVCGGTVLVCLVGLGIWLIIGSKNQPEPSSPIQLAANPANTSNLVAQSKKDSDDKAGSGPAKATVPENPPVKDTKKLEESVPSSTTPKGPAKNDPSDVDLDLKEPWQKDHIAFARLFLGNDLKRRTSEAGTNLFNQQVYDKIKGKKVSWRAMVEANPLRGKGDETVIVAPLSKEATIIIHPLHWSAEAKNQLNGMARGTAVRVSFLLPEDSLQVAPMIMNDGNLLILIHVHGVVLTPQKMPATEPEKPLPKADVQPWREHIVGKLTLRISGQHEPRQVLVFPDRNYKAKLDELLEREKKDITAGRFDLLRLRSQFTPKSVENGVELTFHLVSDSEETWPGKSKTFESAIWGVRHIQAKDAIRVMSYDLQLKGEIQEGGLIRGTATGRFRLDIESPWIVFEGAPFELVPCRVEDNK